MNNKIIKMLGFIAKNIFMIIKVKKYGSLHFESNEKLELMLNAQQLYKELYKFIHDLNSFGKSIFTSKLRKSTYQKLEL
jgi:hypothetical protein